MATKQEPFPMIFYSAPWGEPTKVLVEYLGDFYDVRAGWGEREGWTNNHVALACSEEQVAGWPEGQVLEMSDEELAECFDEETLSGIREAVLEAGGESHV